MSVVGMSLLGWVVGVSGWVAARVPVVQVAVLVSPSRRATGPLPTATRFMTTPRTRIGRPHRLDRTESDH